MLQSPNPASLRRETRPWGLTDMEVSADEGSKLGLCENARFTISLNRPFLKPDWAPSTHLFFDTSSAGNSLYYFHLISLSTIFLFLTFFVVHCLTLHILLFFSKGDWYCSGSFDTMSWKLNITRLFFQKEKEFPAEELRVSLNSFLKALLHSLRIECL